MKAYVHLWKYLSEVSLQLEIFQTEVLEKIKTQILSSVILFFSENRAVLR